LQQAEYDFNLVQPTGRSGREMKPNAPLEPGQPVVVSFVSGIVIEDDIASVPYYGIWDVEEFAIDGTTLPPLTTDRVRWQRVVFDARDYDYVQHMSGPFMVAFLKLDRARKVLAFDHGGKPRPELKELFGTPWNAEFACDDSIPDILVLTGKYQNRPATVKLRKNRSRFFLTPHERQWILRGMPVFPYV
jgi:hypothetical protein